ncbi:MAG: Ig-like domain-containing protein [Lachnospiraceae bacterium]|nr:Ig-like domain-containing protein [Lachnospiraceae bacterium]
MRAVLPQNTTYFTCKSLKVLFVTLIVLLALFSVYPLGASAKEKDPGESSQKETTPEPKFADKKVTLYTGYEPYYSALVDVDEEATVKYKSSMRRVAKVDSDGIVTPLSAGKTVITATIKTGKQTVKCTMNVVVKDPYYELEEFPEGVFAGTDTVYSVKRYGYEGPVTFRLTGSQYASIEPLDSTSCILHATAPGNISVEVESLGKVKKQDVRIYEGTGTIFVVHPDSKPYLNRYITRGDYNEYTSCYFLLRSYLERLETVGGGMLVLKKGTYPVIATLCVPSNTTILFEDGAVIRKIDNTDTRAVTATTSLFQCVSATHTSYPFKGYGGEHDISFIGEGRSGIDLAGVKCTAIMMCHNKNVRISGLYFKNVNGLHFIELDASRDVDISYNWFTGYTATSSGHKEAINIDTPDRNTGGFVQGWTSYDRTPNKNIFITDNVFKDLEVGVGTHRYSQAEKKESKAAAGSTEQDGETAEVEEPAPQMYHTGINVLRNSFFNITTYGVRLMNWKNAVVRDNSFEETAGFITGATVYDEEGNATLPKLIGIYINGAVNPIVTGNYFSGFDTVISACPWKNSKIKSNPSIDGGSSYDITYNDFSEKTLEYFKKNKAVECTNQILVYETYGKAGTVEPVVYELK